MSGSEERRRTTRRTPAAGQIGHRRVRVKHRMPDENESRTLRSSPDDQQTRRVVQRAVVDRDRLDRVDNRPRLMPRESRVREFTRAASELNPSSNTIAVDSGMERMGLCGIGDQQRRECTECRQHQPAEREERRVGATDPDGGAGRKSVTRRAVTAQGSCDLDDSATCKIRTKPKGQGLRGRVVWAGAAIVECLIAFARNSTKQSISAAHSSACSRPADTRRTHVAAARNATALDQSATGRTPADRRQWFQNTDRVRC